MPQQSFFHSAVRAAVAFPLLWVFSVSSLHSACGQTFRSGVEYGSVTEIPLADAEEAFATYDAATGDVYLSVGSGVNIVRLISDEDFLFLLGNLRPEIIDEFSVPKSEGGRTELLFAESFARPFENSGTFDLGPILPANNSITSIAQFEQVFLSPRVQSTVPGSSAVTTAAFNLIPRSGIPEPSAAVLLAAMGLLTSARRCRYTKILDD